MKNDSQDIQPLKNVIILASPKGGTGKTTISINLGRALQRQGFSVAIADLDSATQSALRWVTAWRTQNPDASAEPPVPSVTHFTEHVGRQLLQMANTNDVVIIDAGAGAPRQNVEALRYASFVIIPTAPSPVDLRATFEMANQMRYLAQINNGLPHCRILLNTVDMRKSSTQQTIAQFMNSDLPVQPMRGVVPASESLVNSSARGVSIYDYPGSTPALKQVFTALAGEVATIMNLSQRSTS